MDDPFTLLELPVSWSLSVEEVRAAQRKHSVMAHPDRQMNANKRLEAQELSARINAAAAQLLDSLSRGDAILAKFAPLPRPADPKFHSTFLLQIMQLREAIHAAESEDAQREVMQQVRAATDEIELETKASMSALIAQASAQRWSAAFDALNRLRAIRRANAELRT